MSTTEDTNPKEDLVILYDEAHGQWFNTSRMHTVLTMVNTTSGGTLYVNKSPFNATNLVGIDVVIITNPGNESTFTVDEAFYLRQYLKRGGRLFLLSNPYSVNETLSGRSSVLNELLTNIDDGDLSLDELNECDGLGLNVYQLNQTPEFFEILKNIKLKNKFLAIHAGEVEDEVETALTYNPDIIIHATKATAPEIRKMKELNISVVCCPRSNLTLGVGIQKIQKMIDLKINVCLGTDNVMLNSPDMWQEMEFVSNVCGIDPEEILKMATVNAASVFKLNSGIIKKDKNADLIFIGKDSLNLKFNWDLISVIVSECSPENVWKVMIDGDFVVDKDDGKF